MRIELELAPVTDDKICDLCGKYPFAEYSVRVYTGINSDDQPAESECMGEQMDAMAADLVAVAAQFESSLQQRWPDVHVKVVLT